MHDNEIMEYEQREQDHKNGLKRLMGNKIVLAIASIVFGLVLVIWQRSAVDTFVRILGIVMCAMAAVFLLMYACKKEKKGAYIVAGILLAIIGVFFLLRPGLIVVLFPFIMGLILIISGVMDFANVIGLPKGVPARTPVLVVSAIVILMGVLCLFRPGFIAEILILFIGIMLIFNGAFDLIVMATQSWKNGQ